jgi:rhodanese-related sulfurtransferase
MAQLLEFAGNHPFLVGSLVLLTVLVIVYEVRLKAAGPELGPADAVRVINGGATVVDVRPAAEFAQGHVVGARNLPLDRFGDQLESLAKKKDRPVIVYCEMGNSSVKAAAALRQAGFSQVLHLKGGLMAWRRENLPLATGAGGKKSKTKKA